MKKIFQRVLIGAAVSVVIYFVIAIALIITDAPIAPATEKEAVDFTTAIDANYSNMPEMTLFTSRDGQQLGYRLYGDTIYSNRIVILIHGSGWHGMQFHPMASYLAERGDLVIVPDLRGHGVSPARRGDVDHIGQLEEDLADLIDRLEAIAPDKPVIIGGHSSGGGLVVRFAGGEYGDKADGFILLAPFLKYNAPTTKPNSGGWAHAATRRIIGLTMLNSVGITALNHLPVIAFSMPRSVLDGPYGATATTQYTFRLNTSFAPRSDYQADLAAMDRPVLLIAGDADEAFDASRYEDVISEQTTSGTYHIVFGGSHIGILTDQHVFEIMQEWLENIPSPG